MHDVEDVLPQVVITGDMSLETVGILVKGVSVNGADEADVSHVEVDRLLEVTQLRECVDDDTEQDVDHHNDNQDMEGTVEEELHEE